MKTAFINNVLFLLFCSQLKAQPFQLGEVFDNRFENHT
jgi:hypothetical protein